MNQKTVMTFFVLIRRVGSRDSAARTLSTAPGLYVLHDISQAHLGLSWMANRLLQDDGTLLKKSGPSLRHLASGAKAHNAACRGVPALFYRMSNVTRWNPSIPTAHCILPRIQITVFFKAVLTNEGMRMTCIASRVSPAPETITLQEGGVSVIIEWLTMGFALSRVRKIAVAGQNKTLPTPWGSFDKALWKFFSPCGAALLISWKRSVTRPSTRVCSPRCVRGGLTAELREMDGLRLEDRLPWRGDRPLVPRVVLRILPRRFLCVPIVDFRGLSSLGPATFLVSIIDFEFSAKQKSAQVGLLVVIACDFHSRAHVLRRKW
ncbi:uncharacterized protein BT62DRAFT_1079231 [Guyanagaster necrorhizus]|uniref:Uncharacterized protein n=1 Tax=Guyanagaster necrorhizus TaxID=856835 RepID=A0A9P7VMF3_9AGAR|nr:uncharacterized protein BT62DRAFT_1079231 [Guyanagaster necrorhizus MCA 3950]KAG7442631.1 hypothetical protein BT62DRAFT_1079231 [Guyanagaster necrorhizus MCA 3950]